MRHKHNRFSILFCRISSMVLNGYLNELKDISEDEEIIWLRSEAVECLNVNAYNMPSLKAILYLNENKEFCGIKIKRTDISYKLNLVEIIAEDKERIDLGTLISAY